MPPRRPVSGILRRQRLNSLDPRRRPRPLVDGEEPDERPDQRRIGEYLGCLSHAATPSNWQMTQRTDPAAMSGQRRRAGRAEVERDVVGGIPASGLDGIKPAGWSPVRHAVGHLAGPAAFAVLAMVESADDEGEI